MRRRSGQAGTIVRKGKQFHVKFYFDTPEGRIRKSEPVGPAVGPNRITKTEAARKGTELVNGLGVNTEAHLVKAQKPQQFQTFQQRVAWCRKNHKAWTDGKPGPIETMEGHLEKHILPRLGNLTLDMVNETCVQEFVAELKAAKFERRRKDGSLIKTYRLARKSVLNIVGVVKLVVGRKVWKTWELNLGKPQRQRQPYFTEEQFARIIAAAPKRYKVYFTLLAATGLRCGEAVALHLDDLDLDNGVIYVRRNVWRGLEQTPKTENAVRQVDIDAATVATLRAYIGASKRTYLFESCHGTPWNANNIRNRVLKPLLDRLGIPTAGLHAFRHGRVTVLRKRGTPGDLQKLWIGHSSLRTGDRYSHTDEELEYRRAAAANVALDLVVRANRAKKDSGSETDAEAVTSSKQVA